MVFQLPDAYLSRVRELHLAQYLQIRHRTGRISIPIRLKRKASEDTLASEEGKIARISDEFKAILTELMETDTKTIQWLHRFLLNYGYGVVYN